MHGQRAREGLERPTLSTPMLQEKCWACERPFGARGATLVRAFDGDVLDEEVWICSVCERQVKSEGSMQVGRDGRLYTLRGCPDVPGG